MPDNIATQAVQIASNPQMTVGEVGGLTGAVVAAAMGFAFVWSKFRAGSSTDSAITTLYSNLSEQIDKLTARLDAVEEERDVWQARAVDLEGKVKKLEALEAENTKLIKRLDIKDDLLRIKDEQIATLLQEAALKSAQIMNLTDKVHELEIRFEKSDRDRCVNCEFKK